MMEKPKKGILNDFEEATFDKIHKQGILTVEMNMERLAVMSRVQPKSILTKSRLCLPRRTDRPSIRP